MKLLKQLLQAFLNNYCSTVALKTNEKYLKAVQFLVTFLEKPTGFNRTELLQRHYL